MFVSETATGEKRNDRRPSLPFPARCSARVVCTPPAAATCLATSRATSPFQPAVERMSTQRELASRAEMPSAFIHPSRMCFARARCDSFSRVLWALGWPAIEAVGKADANDGTACSVRRVAIVAIGRSSDARAFLADLLEGCVEDWESD